MNIRSLLVPALCFSLLTLAAGGSSSAASEKAPDSNQASLAQKKREAELKIAMPADTVLHIMGKPLSVKPMPSDKGKVEVWTYETQVNSRMEHLDVSTPVMTSVMGPDGNAHPVQTGVHVEYRDIDHITIQVTELLMFNDHYVTQKAYLRESQQMH